MSEREGRSAGPEPRAAELLLHYANAHPDERTWRGIVLGPGVVLNDSRSADLTPFGVASLVELMATLEKLRSVLSRIIVLDSPYAADAQAIAKEITELSAPIFQGWKFSPINERFFELWDTKETSFEELVFFTLAQVLKEIPFRDLHRCEACTNFFLADSKRERKFCSNTCRSRITVRKHREAQTQASAKRSPRKARPQPAGTTAKARRRP